MENAINTLRIQNFKSIKDATMHPRRVNLIIGQPNVGKSNILEAMSLLGAGLYDVEDKFMKGAMRYETISNLFYDNEINKGIMIDASKRIVRIEIGNNGGYKFLQSTNNFFYLCKKQIDDFYTSQIHSVNPNAKDLKELMREPYFLTAADRIFDESGQEENLPIVAFDLSESGKTINSTIKLNKFDELPKKYTYFSNQPHSFNYKYSFLQPPSGHNLWEVVQRNPELRREIAALFKSYGLNLVLRVGERKFEIQKQVEDLVYSYPYSLIADTLQRIIFYLAAIESNDDSVLLFEEPEAHQFPVYTSMLGRKIVESRNNQFFIATHSPYLVTEILEQMVPYDNQLGELAIFVAYYEDYQTKIKQLSDEEVRDIRGDGVDIFYNLSRFTPGNNLYA